MSEIRMFQQLRLYPSDAASEGASHAVGQFPWLFLWDSTAPGGLWPFRKGLHFETGNSKWEQVTVALYVVLMATTVVAVDFLFFRNRFGERLIVDIGIVLVFAVFYLRFLKRP